MQRRQSSNDFNPVDYIELSRKTAIHEAGHAAACYFGNKRKQLPPVFFQIIINDCSHGVYDNCTTKVKGGRLIHTLPSSIEEAICNFSLNQQHAYQQAFEADIINLLVGSIAEANYVALRDNEPISPELIPLYALHNYGGSADLEIIYQYFDCFIADAQQQEKKMIELFLAAFDFISDHTHWSAITTLANHILTHDKHIIDYEEVVGILNMRSVA
ncbi:hypothetical protein BCS42_17165 [Crenothrix sp. D3]|jgi:hypothetical protein|nr:hypothetical protein BCS42_17165 [Crenothrix sp. D3]